LPGGQGLMVTQKGCEGAPKEKKNKFVITKKQFGAHRGGGRVGGGWGGVGGGVGVYVTVTEQT